jgi:hypothetical protein
VAGDPVLDRIALGQNLTGVGKVEHALATFGQLSGPVDVPLPTCPSVVLPQQSTAPVDDGPSGAHVWSPPTAIPIGCARPSTVTGVGRAVVVLSPSCPAELSPQHATDEFERRAHACPALEFPFAPIALAAVTP